MKSTGYFLIFMAIVLLLLIIISPMRLGQYKLTCVLAVLREINDLYVGCLVTITADESTFSYLFY